MWKRPSELPSPVSGPSQGSRNRFFPWLGSRSQAVCAPRLCTWLEDFCRDESSEYQPQSQLLGTRAMLSLPHPYPEREGSGWWKKHHCSSTEEPGLWVNSV